jgi:lipopolysaccharide/colanic/teichoic acid biosynthesis glycosyltransferase
MMVKYDKNYVRTELKTVSAYIPDTSPYTRESVLKNQYLSQYLQQPIHPSVLSGTKRLIDIIGAIVGLIITAFLAIPIAIANFSYDRGSVFYKQTRCGLHGQTFQIWKFRSMVVNADKLKHLVENEAQGHIFKCANDPRITPIGRLLRRSSLDELPQFWNVLKGEMSLVGTRPPTVDEVQNYQTHHYVRLQVKPGMTGEWQANGRSSIKDFEQIVQMDIDYQQKWSAMYDLKLIIKTIWVVIKASGAY